MTEPNDDLASLIPDFPPLRRSLDARGEAASVLADPAAPVVQSSPAVASSIEPFEKAPPVTGRLGRETKLGLAVVGTLLSVFGGLLIYRFVETGAAIAADPSRISARSTSPTATNDKPTLVAAQRDRDEQRVPVDRWARKDQAVNPRTDDDFPPANFLPTDRYASRAGDDVPNHFADPGEIPAADNPFASSPATSDDAPLEPFDAPASRYRGNEIPYNPPADAEPSYERTEKNPLRRTSNEEPIDSSVGRGDDLPSWATRDEFEDAPLPRRPVPSREPEFSTPTIADRAPENRFGDTRVADNRATDSRTADMRDAQLPRYRQEPTERPLARSTPADPPANGKYVVGPNDSLWTISEKVYGTGNYFKALAEYNKFNLPNPNRLSVGATVSVPPTSVLDQKYPSLVPKQRKSALVEPRTIQASARGRIRGENTYVVEQGDTLFDIARYELGKASRWGEIYDLNRDKLSQDFDYLQPGTQLNMPSKNPPDNMTRSNEAGWQR